MYMIYDYHYYYKIIENYCKFYQKYYIGILITGGIGQYEGPILSSAELYIPDLDRSCSLPDLPVTRDGHTQNSFLTCGGNGTEIETTCEVLIPGDTWRREPYKLTQKRSWHTSWTLNNGTVILLGGGFSSDTSENVTPGLGSAPGFSLKYHI